MGGGASTVAKGGITLRSSICRMLIISLVCVAGLLPGIPSLLAVQSHVVSRAELEQAVLSASRTRSENLKKVEKFFSSSAADRALKSAHLDPVQIKKAIPSLSDQELARLASRADKAQEDFAGGALTNQQITYIIIALATAVIVLIAVH